ncbi:hypothetical protein BDR26DRAFT_891555 [Obelidium mucronatum]|nr:hypothetical protein BDR26DRAFT_891555 [Obelidium mucronatum]
MGLDAMEFDFKNNMENDVDFSDLFGTSSGLPSATEPSKSTESTFTSLGTITLSAPVSLVANQLAVLTITSLQLQPQRVFRDNMMVLNVAAQSTKAPPDLSLKGLDISAMYDIFHTGTTLKAAIKVWKELVGQLSVAESKNFNNFKRLVICFEKKFGCDVGVWNRFFSAKFRPDDWLHTKSAKASFHPNITKTRLEEATTSTDVGRPLGMSAILKSLQSAGFL